MKNDQETTVKIRLDEKRRAVIALGKSGATPGKAITLWGNQVEYLFNPKIANFILQYSRNKGARRDPTERDSELAMRISEKSSQEAATDLEAK